jgi:hypothetical protein
MAQPPAPFGGSLTGARRQTRTRRTGPRSRLEQPHHQHDDRHDGDQRRRRDPDHHVRLLHRGRAVLRVASPDVLGDAALVGTSIVRHWTGRADRTARPCRAVRSGAGCATTRPFSTHSTQPNPPTRCCDRPSVADQMLCLNETLMLTGAERRDSEALRNDLR